MSTECIKYSFTILSPAHALFDFRPFITELTLDIKIGLSSLSSSVC